jgi:hypothetical protein
MVVTADKTRAHTKMRVIVLLSEKGGFGLQNFSKSYGDATTYLGFLQIKEFAYYLFQIHITYTIIQCRVFLQAGR